MNLWTYKINSKIKAKDILKIFKKVLNYQNLFYILKFIKTKLIRKYYKDFLIEYFKIKII